MKKAFFIQKNAFFIKAIAAAKTLIAIPEMIHADAATMNAFSEMMNADKENSMAYAAMLNAD